jgi:hypothetical protein
MAKILTSTCGTGQSGEFQRSQSRQDVRQAALHRQSFSQFT